MQATTSQAIALVLHGNAHLQGHPIADLMATNRSFAYCKEVSFLRTNWRGKTVPLCEDPNLWCELIKRNGIQNVTLRCVPSEGGQSSDWQHSVFVGAGARWLIEAVGPKGADIYEGYWRVGDENDPESKIWWVNYLLLQHYSRPVDHIGRPELDKAIASYLACLSEIRQFALRVDEEGWATEFKSAADILSGSEPVETDFDLSPEGFLKERAFRALVSCHLAWVFGGEGSWNDMGFEDDEQADYEDVSERFFHELTQLIEVATNTSAAAIGSSPVRNG